MVGTIALWVVLVTALVSAADYFRRFGRPRAAEVADIRIAREQRTGRKVV
jgi:hypothetical protein